MMTLSWKYLVPIGFGCLVFTLIWELGVGAAPALETVSGAVLSLAALGLLVVFLRQVRKNVALVHGDRVDLTNW
jgi:hypothetical protein